MGAGLALSAFAMSGLGARRRSKAPQRAAAARSVACNAEAPAAASSVEPVLKLGTRGSPLALAQATMTKRLLGEAHPELAAEGAVEIRIISTEGDRRLEIALAQIGGKGLFTRELDGALMTGEVDFCVHSTKDVPTQLVEGTELAAMLPREDTRDVLISRDSSITRFEDMPAGSVIGTASLRRQSQIYSKNPDLKCVNFRGNVQTRLRKLQNGDVDATLLALAGLKRMNMEQHATRVLEWEEMLPAIAQGAICIQCKSDDEKTKRFLAPLAHKPTEQAVVCERAFLAALDGNCRTPIAGQAVVADGQLKFQGLVASPDGKLVYKVDRDGSPDKAEAIGTAAGEEVRKQAGEKFFEEMQTYVQEVQAANTKPTKASA